MKKITRGIKLYICNETEKIYLEFKDYFKIKHPKNMLAYYLLIREPTDALEKLIRDYYEKCENEYEKERERRNQFVQKTAQKLYAELSPERRAKLYMNANPAEEHFDLGLYVRNKYIFTDDEENDLPDCSPDLLSSEILSCLVSILVGYV